MKAGISCPCCFAHQLDDTKLKPPPSAFTDLLGSLWFECTRADCSSVRISVMYAILCRVSGTRSRNAYLNGYEYVLPFFSLYLAGLWPLRPRKVTVARNRRTRTLIICKIDGAIGILTFNCIGLYEDAYALLLFHSREEATTLLIIHDGSTPSHLPETTTSTPYSITHFLTK